MISPSLIRLTQRAGHIRFFHAVQVKRGGAVIAQGYNHGHTHAEVHALKKVWPNKRAGTTVVSIRVTRSGKLAMAKPCDACELYMRRSGVKKVIYSNSRGDLVEERYS